MPGPASRDRIAIIASERGPTGARLVSIDEHGDRQFELVQAATVTARDVNPTVSPDGRWIVFQVYRDGAWLLDVERGAMQRVLQDPSAEEFAWSPDGRRVAYHSQRSGGWNLWTMAAP